MKKVTWVTFAFLCLLVGLYPLLYILVDRDFFIDNNAGLLATKPTELLNSVFWNTAFYGHIIFGGIALLVGWMQFSKRLRTKRLKLHRNIGKIYIITVLISGVCGLYVSIYATGGIISSFGFGSLAIIWLSTTIFSFKAIKNKDISLHEKLMIYSFAACFAAVTLRLWLPLLTIVFGEFIAAYKVVAWLCWVPNLIVAHLLLSKTK